MVASALAYDIGAEAVLNGFGTALNSGTIKIYTGTQPALNVAPSTTLLVTMTFGSTAFAAATASAGTASMSANAITSGTAGNTGTAGFFVLCNSGGTPLMSGSVGTSAADLIMSSLSISSSANISCSAFTITLSETWT